MKNSEINIDNVSTIDRQKKYVNDQESLGGGLGIVFADAFIRGMREIGYKSHATAFAEPIDNAIQAQANNISLRFKGDNNIESMCLIDDGIGMIPKMISYAVRWGGTDRENGIEQGDGTRRRKGFGRYGYGLPSSAVSMCRKYTVFSKITGGEWNAVIVDIDELTKVASSTEAVNKMLQPILLDPPKWAFEKGDDLDPQKMDSGTVIVYEKLDKLTPGWKSRKGMKKKLLEKLGLIYRKWLSPPKLWIDQTIVEPVDPLFLMENARFYEDENDTRAKRVPTKAFEMEGFNGHKGVVRITASILPPNFWSEAKSTNARFKIAKENHGISICRDGREIAVVKPRAETWQNYDRNVRIEIDFDPVLDQYFGITTSKQQITIEAEMWDKLEASGCGDLSGLIRGMRKDFKLQKAALEKEGQERKGESEPRDSEVVMKQTEKFKSQPLKLTDKQKEKAAKNLKKKVEIVSKEKRQPVKRVLKAVQEESELRPYKIEFEAIEEGPIYLAKRVGSQKVLVLNTLHPFYSKVYSRSAHSKSAIETLLFVMVDHELDANEETVGFYQEARRAWSARLHHAIEALISDAKIRDEESFASEMGDSSQ